LEQIPPHLRRTIQYFTTDMWEGYLNAITEYIENHEDVTAQLVVDRFHVAQHYRDDFDDLRKQEMKRLKRELPAQTYDQDCKGTLWILRKNHVNLEEEERERLRQLLKHSPELHAAYTLREELTAIFNRAETPEAGERWLLNWMDKVQKQNVTCFDGFLKTLKHHWTPIINYFADRVTSGFVEGLNNKIKTIKRRCYGIRKTSTLFQRLWLDLRGYDFFATNYADFLSTT